MVINWFNSKAQSLQQSILEEAEINKQSLSIDNSTQQNSFFSNNGESLILDLIDTKGENFDLNEFSFCNSQVCSDNSKITIQLKNLLAKYCLNKNTFDLVKVKDIITQCQNSQAHFKTIQTFINNNIKDIVINNEQGNMLIEYMLNILQGKERAELCNNLFNNCNAFLQDYNGCKLLQSFINIKNMKEINSILYYILKNFSFYSSIETSVNIIKKCYALNLDFINYQLNQAVIGNIGNIVNSKYGKDIIETSMTYSNEKTRALIVYLCNKSSFG